MSQDPKQPHEKGHPGTTGHSWDGIEELNNPLPRWWLWTFYATIIWGIAYTIAYPAWPLISGATPGVLGYSTRAELRKDIAEFDAKNHALKTGLEAADLSTLTPGTPLYDFAANAGAAVFRANCSQCHGAGAAGAKGYPNLLDDDWLWGGDVESILTTVSHGVRNTTDPDAQLGAGPMPAFGRDKLLEAPQIEAVVEHVLSISGQAHNAELASAGVAVFAESCASCHGEDGTGLREFGAPNLADAITLYGGDRDSLTRTITNGRNGVMPAWGQRLAEADVKAVALYVHQLGGGE